MFADLWEIKRDFVYRDDYEMSQVKSQEGNVFFSWKVEMKGFLDDDHDQYDHVWNEKWQDNIFCLSQSV